jgi:hypothetical protein
MTQREILERMLAKYGEAVSVKGNSVKGILRPLQHKGTALLKDEEQEGGAHMLYTGPVTQKLCTGDAISTASRTYTVKRTDTVQFKGEELYIWAVLAAAVPNADKEIYLNFNGKRVADIGYYREQTAQQSRTISAWGEQQPARTVPGRMEYVVALEQIRPVGNENVYALADFELIIVKEDKKVIYSGCQWRNIDSTGGKGNSAVLKMELRAAKRTEIEGVRHG